MTTSTWTDLDTPTQLGPAPIVVQHVIVRWSRRCLGRITVLRLLAPLARLVDRLVPLAVAVVLIGGVGAVLIGRNHAVGPADTPTGYQPIHLVLIGLGLVVIVAVTVDVLRFGRRNTTLAQHRVNLPDDPDRRSVA